MKRVRYNEDFLVKYSSEVPVTSSLPFKLQKRELLEKLGFPFDKSLLMSIRDYKQIEQIISEYSKNTPFLIGIHLKPMSTYITPFFLIDRNGIKYRDEFRNIQFITQEEMFEKIRGYHQQSWIEFVKVIWGPATIMGRMIYISLSEQIIEIQKGVMPDNLGENKEKFPYFTTELYFFEMSYKVECRYLLLSSGFKKIEVDNVVNSLAKYINEFEALKRIANLPTLEFGYTIDRGLIVVDVDWPSQYQY